jgi:hypothetical protein
MAFMGLTHCGPQSYFKENALHADAMVHYDDAMVEEAFDLIDRQRTGFIVIDELRLVLAELYHSQPPEYEVKFLMRELAADSLKPDLDPAALRALAAQRRPDTYKGGHHLMGLADVVVVQVDKPALLAACAKLRGEQEPVKATLEDPANEFKSNGAFQHEMSRHRRSRLDPQQKYRVPITTAQELGWYTQNSAERVQRLPNNSCEETRFQSEMIRLGVYY